MRSIRAAEGHLLLPSSRHCSVPMPGLFRGSNETGTAVAEGCRQRGLGAGVVQTKLYVSNLSRLATSSSVRQHFGACGVVLEVEMLAERASTTPSAAYVTMATPAGAALAVDTLHGRLLHDRSLMVSLVLGEPESRSKAAAAAAAKSTGVAVRQQYRDRHGMTYELDWLGQRLTFHFLFPTDDHVCRVQARTGAGVDMVEAAAATRELALNAVAQACQARPDFSAGNVPWEEVAHALKSVRAV